MNKRFNTAIALFNEMDYLSEEKLLDYGCGFGRFFDKIVCYGVFDACFQENAICEMLRILKAGGELLITGKNRYYNEDDGQAIIAEEAARKKGHPNYFTDVNYMLKQLMDCVAVEKQRFWKRNIYNRNARKIL